jgi:hypothetical protein
MPDRQYHVLQDELTQARRLARHMAGASMAVVVLFQDYLKDLEDELLSFEARSLNTSFASPAD